MKKINFFTAIIVLLTITNFAKAELNIPLKKYLDEKDLEKANYWYTKAVEQDNVAASNIVKYFEDQKNVLNFDYWKKKSRK